MISTYNRTRLLIDGSLPSVMRQTVPVDEIVIVGDGTERKTGEAIASLGDSRIRFWNLRRDEYPDHRDERWWLAGIKARNYGLEMATSDWICPLDDDDEWTPDHVEVLLSAVTEDDYDIAYGQSLKHRPDNWNELIGSEPLAGGNLASGAEIIRASLNYRYDPACVSRQVSLDWDLHNRIAADGRRWVFVPKVIHHYYPHPRWLE